MVNLTTDDVLNLMKYDGWAASPTVNVEGCLYR